MHWRRNTARRILACGLMGFLCAQVAAQGLDIESQYSPLTRKRAPRSSTDYIILHTTEGPGKGSLAKLRRYGEAHYMVDTNGKVYRIIERNKIAMHAGRSMWFGRTNLDNISIGIEVVGYHDKPMTASQIRALRELLRQLQSIYGIPDNRVLPHSMVAYGRPNRWHPKAHRGRKRCAMLMGRASIRAQIGLTSEPGYDPDVRAGRLVVADAHLERVLFGPDPGARSPAPGNPAGAGIRTGEDSGDVIVPGRSAWDIARENYNSPSTVYVFPDGSVKRGNDITNWSKMPKGTRVRVQPDDSEHESEVERVQVIGRDGKNAWEIAGDAFHDAETIYFLRNGQVRQGDQLSKEELDTLPVGTRMLVGYAHGGVLTSRRRAFDVCGPRWNLASTFYRFPDGSIRPGNTINDKSIPNQAMVFLPR